MKNWQFALLIAVVLMTPRLVALANFDAQVVILPSSTVANLGTCNASNRGQLKTATDITTVTLNGAPTGGGSNIAPVHCNGTAWTTH